MPTSAEIAAGEHTDICRHDLLPTPVVIGHSNVAVRSESGLPGRATTDGALDARRSLTAAADKQLVGRALGLLLIDETQLGQKALKLLCI
jgi:hypothetical protein